MKSKIFLIFLFSMFLISFASAGVLNDWDNVKGKVPINNPGITRVGNLDLPYNNLWEKYPVIKVENNLGLGKILFEGALTNHSEVCEGDFCYSEWSAYLSGDYAAYDDIEFRTQQEDGSWKVQDVRDWKIMYWGEIKDYETQCIDLPEVYSPENNTYYTPQECSNVQVGTHEGWIKINAGEKLPEGTYKFRLEAHKKPSRTVDWVIKTNGETLNEWAVWGGNGFIGNEYQLIVLADNLSEAGLEINGVVVTDLGGGFYKINTTNADDEVSRALVMQTLFYGTTGSDPRATSQYINATEVYSSDSRDNNKRGIYASLVKTTEFASTTYTGTFSNTATNYDVSSWSLTSLTGSFYAGTYARWENPTSTTLNERTTSGTTNEIGTDKSADEKDNPSTAQLDVKSNAGGTATVKTIILSDGSISWAVVNPISTTYSETDFYADEGFPIMISPNASVILNSPADSSISTNYDVTFNATANVTNGAYLTNMSLWTNITGTWALNETTVLGVSNLNFSDGYLKAYYKLDEGGGTILDETDNNIDGTIVGTVTNTSGWFNTAYDFDTSSDYLDLGNTLDIPGAITLSAWIYTDDVTNGQGIITRGSGSNADHDQYSLTVYSGNVRFQIRNTALTFYLGTKSISAGSWHHVVGVWAGGTNKVQVYVDGVKGTDSSNFTGTQLGGATFTRIGYGSPGFTTFSGKIDEVGIWNRALTTTEISELYNSGNGLEYNQYYNSTSSTQTWNKTISDTTIWNVQACDTDGDCGWATSNYTVYLDAEAPTDSVESPALIQDYLKINTIEELNVTFTNDNLDSCWYNHNGTNITIDGCLTGVKNSTTFNYTGTNQITFYANDTVGNLLEDIYTWNNKVTENSRTFNNESFTTESETFSINVTANSSLTAVTLDYSGTEYATTQSGSVYSKTLDIPTANIGNNTVKWKFTYAGDIFYSDNSYQNVTDAIFTLCNATYTDQYLNITFKDEATLTYINASLPLAQFEYYLGSGAVSKTYEYINTGTQEYNYTYCSNVNQTLHVDPYVQYSATDYPQRIWNPDVTDYTSTVTEQILYLLNSADGLYVTIQVINVADQLLSGVLIEIVRSISGSDVTVASGTTDAAGSATFWLNPDFVHTFTLSKTGFEDYITSFAPTQTGYTFTLSSGDGVSEDYFQGIDYSITPTDSYLENDTEYDFTFTIDSSQWDTSFGFNLRLPNGTIVCSDSETVEGTPASCTYNVNNQSYIYMDYWWLVNETYTNATKVWIIQNTQYSSWSIKNFADDFQIYIASGLFGLDDFGRYLITFMILLFSVGIMSYKYGFTSPMAVSTLVFGVVFFLDVTLGLIPDVRGIENLPTFLAGTILVLSILREVQR